MWDLSFWVFIHFFCLLFVFNPILIHFFINTRRLATYDIVKRRIDESETRALLLLHHAIRIFLLGGVLIGGSTIHSWAGIGLGEGTVEEVVEKVRNSKDARKRWREHDALVIDEVSMIDGALLVRGILEGERGGLHFEQRASVDY